MEDQMGDEHGGKITCTSFTIGKWDTVGRVDWANMPRETSQRSDKDALVIQARQVRDGVDAGFAIYVSPALVTKKLAIRRMNGEIEGWTAPSNTAPKAAR
jgi:hypothetical protein